MDVKPPSGLGSHGRELWRAVIEDVQAGWELDARDLAALASACHAMQRAHELERVVRQEGLTVSGRPHPAIGEARRQRTSAQALLKQVETCPPAMKTGHLNVRQRAELRSAQLPHGTTG